jgi:hypothetical protein
MDSYEASGSSSEDGEGVGFGVEADHLFSCCSLALKRFDDDGSVQWNETTNDVREAKRC